MRDYYFSIFGVFAVVVLAILWLVGIDNGSLTASAVLFLVGAFLMETLVSRKKLGP